MMRPLSQSGIIGRNWRRWMHETLDEALEAIEPKDEWDELELLQSRLRLLMAVSDKDLQHDRIAQVRKRLSQLKSKFRHKIRSERRKILDQYTGPIP